MSREVHVRFWESAGVKLPRATRLPLYRQSQIFARQGIELDRSTLCDWVGRACWWLEPLWRLLHRHVMSSTRIFADDTPLPVLDPGRGRTKTGRLWGYALDDRPWGGEHPAGGGLPLRRGPQGRASGRAPGRVPGHPAGGRLLRLQEPAGGPPAGRDQARLLLGALPKGLLRDRPGPRARRWPRRRCGGSARSTPSRPRSAAAQPRSGARSGRSGASRSSRTCSPGSRRSWRGSRASSDLAEAIRYALSHWQGLVLFLDDGRLELDTNTVERAIRPIVIRPAHCTPLRSTAWKDWEFSFRRSLRCGRIPPRQRRL